MVEWPDGQLRVADSKIMGWTGVLYWLLARRLRASWMLLAISSFGILAAVTLMSVGAVYSRALAEGGLRHKLATTAPTILNAHVILQNRPLGPADYRKLRADVEEITRARLDYLVRDIQRFGRTQPNLHLVFSAEGQPPPVGGPFGRPFFLTGFREHSRLVEGRWPETAPVLHDRGLELEAVIGDRAASSLGLQVGARMSIFPFRTDSSERIVLNVVGLAEPKDPREEYWMNSLAYFRLQGIEDDLLLPFYLREDDFFEGLGTKYPAMVGDFGWFLFVDSGVLTASTVNQTEDNVTGLETDINKKFPRSLVITGLDKSLADYQKELDLARVPLYLFIALIVVVILYAMALVMGLLARSRTEEAGLLRSRGAGLLQVSTLLVLGEGAIAVLAVVAGPFLALAIVRYLLLRTIDPLGVGPGGLSVGLSADMFVVGTIGGLLALGVLAASALTRARLGTMESLRDRARPPTVPLLHRYYVDLLVLAALGLLWWQISSRGGFIERDVSTRTLQADPSLLFGPVLGLLAAALLALRVLPWLVRFFAWAGSRFGPPWLAFSLVRLSRDPLPHGALVVILMMAAALGVFGASFQATLARSHVEQALYRLGGDLAVRGRSFSDSSLETVAVTPGVQAVSPIARDTVNLLDGFPGDTATLLGVDPVDLPAAAWFKEDFAGKDLRELLSPITRTRWVSPTPGQGGGTGIAIPTGGERIGIWAKLEIPELGQTRLSLNLWARVQDGDGRYRNVLLGDLRDPPEGAPAGSQPPSSKDEGPEWSYFEAPLTDESRSLKHPARVVSIFMSKRALTAAPPGILDLDDITVQGPSIPPPGVIIEGYEEIGGWTPLAIEGETADTIERTSPADGNGRAGLRFTWQEPLGTTPRGVFLPHGPFPLPTVGGSMFHVDQRLRVRAGRQVVPLVVMDTTGYFPTLDPSSRPFLLVALADYREYLHRSPQGSFKAPQEIWVSPQEQAGREQVVHDLAEVLPGFVSVQDRDAQVEMTRRNPLAGGGWNGLTILGLSAVTVAVVLTLAMHAAVAIHTCRVDLTVARALGFSRAQIFLSLGLERLLVAVLGLGAGGAIGFGLGRWVLGFLDITASGRPVLPPMDVSVQGWLAALVFAGLAAASLLSLLFATLVARRLRVPDILRTGE